MTNKSRIPFFLVLFDAECLLCQKAVHMIIEHGSPADMKLCSLQDFKQAFAHQVTNIPSWKQAFEKDSLLVHANGKWHTEAEGAIKVGLRLQGWPRVMARIGSFFPRTLQSLGYRLVASNRMRFFGRTDKCLVLGQDEKPFFWEPPSA